MKLKDLIETLSMFTRIDIKNYYTNACYYSGDVRDFKKLGCVEFINYEVKFIYIHSNVMNIDI